MASLLSQREKSVSKTSGEEASNIVQNPLRMFGYGIGENSTRNSPRPAPWEVGCHDSERSRMEREQEHREFLSVYSGMKKSDGDGDPCFALSSHLQPPSSVLGLMDFPNPAPQHVQQLNSSLPSLAKHPANKQPVVPPVLYQE